MKAFLNNKEFTFGLFNPSRQEELLIYLNGLSPESKKRFGPHPFSREALEKIENSSQQYLQWTALCTPEQEIIAYTIVQKGWVEFDRERLQNYGLKISSGVCTLAPSVADNWQGKGLGTAFQKYVLTELKETFKMKRVILWGGVQADNLKAVTLYNKLGFRKLGSFDHNGPNFDMILEF